VAEEPFEDVVALADVSQRPRRVVRVGADEQVDAGAPDLLPLAELVELGARRDQHLAGLVADLGKKNAGGLAVGEEDADGLAGHCVAIFCRLSNASLAIPSQLPSTRVGRSTSRIPAKVRDCARLSV